MIWRALAAAVLAALAACGGAGNQATKPEGPAGGRLTKVPTASGFEVAAVTTVVASPGVPSTLTSADGGLTVSVPPDALTTTVALTVTPISNLARGGIGPAYRLGPEGTTFASPVTLTFQAPAAFPRGTSFAGIVIETQDAQGYWDPVTTASTGGALEVSRDPTANTVTISTTHFSDWAVTWQSGAPVAEGPISLVQGYVGPIDQSSVALPFVATGTATLYFLGDDPYDTSYGLTGTLTIQPPSATFTVGGATCVPAPATITLPLNVAEVHKSTPPVFRWGIGAHWQLSCDDGSTPNLPALFDTLLIDVPAIAQCSGDYAAGQIVSSTELGGTFTTTCGGGAYGNITATWDIVAGP